MFFKGKHLRVTTPKTTNGQIPLIVAGQQQFDVTFAPMTAKKSLEAKNNRLKRTGYSHLMAKIEEVSDEPIAAPAPAAAPAKEKKAAKVQEAPQAENTAAPQNAAALLAQAEGGIKL